MTDSTLTIRLSAKLKAEFLAVARANHRTGAQLIREFVDDYLIGELPQPEEEGYWEFVEAKIDLAEADIRAGRYYAHDEVEAYFARKRGGETLPLMDKAA